MVDHIGTDHVAAQEACRRGAEAATTAVLPAVGR